MEDHFSSLHVEYEPRPRRFATGRTTDGVRYYGEAAVDIIAVQGLGSSYEWTWSTETSNIGTRYYWLKDSIRRDLPHARVLAYDYDTSWFGNPTRVSLEACGARLLQSVLVNRTHAGQTKMCPARARRPIIFIGHSFGGLVIKQSLVLAGRTGPTDHRYNDHQAYLNAVTSIIYLGTPHRGSSFPRLAAWKSWAGNLVGVRTDDTLLRILELDSELLSYLQHEFESIERKPQLAHLLTYCYYETKDIREGPIAVGKVVSESSACLDSSLVRGIEKDHMSLNKFSAGDKDYEEYMRPDLLQCFEKADATAHARFSLRRYGSEIASLELQNLTRLLAPLTSSMKDRFEFNCSEQERTVALRPTCAWLSGTESYTSWRDDKNFSFLWVHGKSGSGKSILAAHITRTLQPRNAQFDWDDVCCSAKLFESRCDSYEADSTVVYFLCGSQPALETPSNMVGTLIDQVLSKYSHNWRMQSIALQAMAKLSAGGNIPELIILLKTLATIVGNIHIIIDGLEENQRYAECIDILKKLSSCHAIRLLVTSQNIYELGEYIRRAFVTAKEIEITDYTRQDIETVAVFRTNELVQVKPHLRAKKNFIALELQRRADGVFQWIKASVTHLDEDGVRAEDVERKLAGFPNDMVQAYDKIMSYLLRKAHGYERKRIQAALWWLCCSAVPLRSSQLLSAILLEDRYLDMTIDEVEYSAVSDQNASYQLKALLGSTIEVIDAGNGEYVVQLWHTSFREYLTDTAGAHSEATQGTLRFPLEQAQAYCAAISMSICSVSCERLSQKARPDRQHLLEDYAWRFWAYHFKASKMDLSTEILSRSFDKMMKAVSGDMLSILVALAQFATSRFAVDEIHKSTILRFVRSFQVAQRSLVGPISDLTTLRRRLPVSEELQQLRERVHQRQDQISRGASTFSTQSIINFMRRYRTPPSQLLMLQTDLLGIDSGDILDHSLTLPLLGSIARGLRIAATSFATDPIFQEMTARTSDYELSITTMLIHVAHLFDCACSFPHWDVMPEFLEPETSFETDAEDKFAPQASIVLYRASVTERNITGLAIATRDLNLIEDYDAVDQQLGLTPTQWYMAMFAYSTFFGTRSNLRQTFILNPMASNHMRRYLYLDLNFAESFAHPRSLLQRYAPIEVREHPFWTHIASLPFLLPLMFARFVKFLLDPLDALLWPGLNMQWFRIQMSLQNFRSFRDGLRLVDDPQSTLNYGHWFLGFVFYLLRRRYFVWFGAHSAPHPVRDLIDAFNNQVQFLENNTHSWKWWIKYNVIFHSGNAIQVKATSLSWKREGCPESHATIPNIFVTFWLCCFLERSICQAVNAIAWPIMMVSLLFQDKQVVVELIKLSFRYWISLAIGVISSIVRIGLMQVFGVWGIFCGLVLLGLSIWYEVSFGALVGEYIWEGMRPLRKTLWLGLRVALIPLFPLLKFVGILVAVGALFFAAGTFSSFCSDPLNLGGTSRDLQVAVADARTTIRDRIPFRIGAEERWPIMPATAYLEASSRQARPPGNDPESSG